MPTVFTDVASDPKQQHWIRYFDLGPEKSRLLVVIDARQSSTSYQVFRAH